MSMGTQCFPYFQKEDGHGRVGRLGPERKGAAGMKKSMSAMERWCCEFNCDSGR